MKKFSALLFSATVLFACNSSDTASIDRASTDSTATSENVSLPYTVEKTPDWEKGSQANVAVAMNALKAFEANDMNALRQQLADSVEFYYDSISFKGPKDSLISLFTGFRNSLETHSVTMRDYESVTSKNRGEDWVGLWYTEILKPKGGKIDSFMVMDDIKIVGGKVAIIDSKSRSLSKR